jgi:diguanylate cyclase (GGDEF)-like protein/PAS domain S-box-containing protein
MPDHPQPPAPPPPPDEANFGLDLAQTRSLLRVIVEAMPNAVVLVDAAGSIQIANSRALRLFGYDGGELDGFDLDLLLPERFRSGHTRARSAFMQQPGTREMGAGRELFGLRKDGVEIPIEVGLDVLRTSPQSFVLASVYDATERREALRTADQATALAQSIIDSAPFAIVATDLDGSILEVSPAAALMLGQPRSELVGRKPYSLRKNAHIRGTRTIAFDGNAAPRSDDCCRDVRKRVDDGHIDQREWTLRKSDGQRLPIDLAVSGLRHRDGRLAGFIGIATDISERKRVQAEMRHMAEHDALTGLPNRMLMRDRLSMSIARARRVGTRVGVLLIDLDHFKHVNDSLGHHVGDRLLVVAARRLTQSVRAYDTVARMGGDEFVIVLPDLPARQDAVEIAEKLVEHLSVPMQIDGHALPVSPSIGVCLFPDDGDAADLLIMNADTAMYVAKEAGRRRAVEFKPQMATAASERWALERALRQALEARSFRVHYQPQVCLRTQRVVGAEALLRWPQDECSYLSPKHFIPVAEQTGLIAAVGEWVMRTACAEIGAIRDRLSPGFRLSVNLSPRQLTLSNLQALVAESLATSGLAPEQLELEITETSLLQDDIVHLIEELRATGVGIAIDDFGTGFSSLSQVTRLPIDCLKIDRSFVRDIDRDSSQAAVTAAIVAIGHRLGIRTIAEGIETAEQLQAIAAQGCAFGQGFLFSKAVPIAELVPAIASIEAA